MNKEELLYNEIYERTKDFGRNQFVREIMRLQRENKELEQKVNQLEEKEELHLNRIDELVDRVVKLETNKDEAIEYIKHSWRLKFDQVYDTSKYLSGWEAEELLSILERGKE